MVIMTTTTKDLDSIGLGVAIGCLITFLIMSIMPLDPVPPTIDGTKVPVIHCQEGEVIGFDMTGLTDPAEMMCLLIADLQGIAPEGALSPEAARQAREEDAYDQGYRDGHAVQHAPSGPLCEEDEVLYPDDYKGPGGNDFSDYKCIHRDDL